MKLDGKLDGREIEPRGARIGVAYDALLRCDAGEWLQALGELDEFYKQFGPRLPQPIADTLAVTRRRFGG